VLLEGTVSFYRVKMDHLRKMVSYRNHAEQLRAMAVDFRHGSDKQTLEKIAATYDRMADELEIILSAEKPVVGPVLPL